MDLSKEINLLLNNFWITKEENPEEYYLLKKNKDELRKFISKNLGSNLIIHDRFIKLEKISNTPSKDQGINAFTNCSDYVYLFLSLLYLEDKPRGEKFILSQFIQYIKNTAITLKLSNIPNWTLSSHRKSLVRVIKYLLDKHVITLKDEENISFGEDENADALYEVTGISNYLIPSFDYEIYNLTTPKEFLDKQWEGQDTEKGDVRRYKIYRDLLYLPAIHKENLTLSEYDYLSKMHKSIENELKNIDLNVEITKNMALIYMDDNSIQKNYFPNGKRITDIILLINTEIDNFIKENNVPKNENETFTLKDFELEKIILDIRVNKKLYFSKYYLDQSQSRYKEEMITTLESYHFISKKSDSYTIYPLIYRFMGHYAPIKETNQMNLFGGDANEL